MTETENFYKVFVSSSIHLATFGYYFTESILEYMDTTGKRGDAEDIYNQYVSFSLNKLFIYPRLSSCAKENIGKLNGNVLLRNCILKLIVESIIFFSGAYIHKWRFTFECSFVS